MSARYQTTGSDNWRYRSGYTYKQRVPMPILPQERPSLLKRIFG